MNKTRGIRYSDRESEETKKAFIEQAKVTARRRRAMRAQMEQAIVIIYDQIHAINGRVLPAEKRTTDYQLDTTLIYG